MPIYHIDKLKNYFKDFLQREFSSHLKQNEVPKFLIVMVGEDFSSLKYIEMKLKLAKELGIETEFLHFKHDVSKNEIEALIAQKQLPQTGIIFQIPIRSDLADIIDNLPFKYDLDLLGFKKYELLKLDFLPPTIGAIDLILKDILLDFEDGNNFLKFVDHKLDLSGLNIAVIGQGKLVGNPLLDYLCKRNASIISINAHTENPKELTKLADILISATGSAHLVDASWLKKPHIKNNIQYPIVIDAGTTEGEIEINSQLTKTLVGDVKTNEIVDLATIVAVPGGVGPITVRYIFWNLLKLTNLK